MKIVVGLGNPGAQYASTPHSVGFEAVDALAGKLGIAWEEKRAFKCLMARGTLAGMPVLLVKPQTFMNLSGDSVAPVVKYHNAALDDLIVIQDDIDLPLGRVRLRKSGSCGGHNGIRNIIERLGSPEFKRIKIGVGKDRNDVIGHVLGKFDPESRKLMDAIIADVPQMVEKILVEGIDRAMNAFNGYERTIRP